MDEFFLGTLFGGCVTIVIFLALDFTPTYEFKEYKLKHGCAFYDGYTGQLVEKDRCEEKEIGQELIIKGR